MADVRHDLAAERRDRLRQALTNEGLDALLITSSVNVTYLTGFSGDSSYLILGKTTELLVSDGRYTQQITEECRGLERHIRPPAKSITEAAAELLNKLNLKAVGLESSQVTLGEFETLKEKAPTISWKTGRDRVEQLRAVKDADEIEQVRAAIHMAEDAFALFQTMIRIEQSEKELADCMEACVRKVGGWCSSFPTIVAADERAALPHAPPSSRTLSESTLLLVDWGVCGRFYKSDLTRILVRRNNSTRSIPDRSTGFDGKLRQIHEVVLQAQEAALRALKPGVIASNVDAAARAVIAAAGYGEFFTHSLGHGLGLQVHESPMLKPGSDTVLRAGMVVTLEPGIYLPGWGGIRIEDDVLITPEGGKVLTSLPRDLDSCFIDV